jgi:hypothetical protein
MKKMIEQFLVLGYFGLYVRLDYLQFLKEQ